MEAHPWTDLRNANNRRPLAWLRSWRWWLKSVAYCSGARRLRAYPGSPRSPGWAQANVGFLAWAQEKIVYARRPDLSCTIMKGTELRLADRIATAVRAGSSAAVPDNRPDTGTCPDPKGC